MRGRPPQRPPFVAALITLAASSLVACGGEANGPTGAGTATAMEVPTGAPARRPTRRYYLARTNERCEIYAQDGEERTEPSATPCPEMLLVGERIRVAGRTCTLENKAQPEREKPVVCPDPLTHFEKQERGL